MALSSFLFNRATELCTEGPIILSPLKTLVQFERISVGMNQYCSHLVPIRDSCECLVYISQHLCELQREQRKSILPETLVANSYREPLLSR